MAATATQPVLSAPHGGPAEAACPLWAVLAFAFVNSLGSGVVSNGIFFMAKQNFGFSAAQNYLLAIVYGVAYIPAALAIGPLLRRMAAAHGVFNPRLAVGACIAVMSAVCGLPWAVQAITGAATPPAWTLWVLMPVYSACCGMLWPMVEAFVSGGRTQGELLTAIGRFNVCWSSALVLGMLGVSPLAESQGALALLLLGIAHVLSLGLLLPFPGFPAKHEHHAENRPHPIVYHQLLSLLRWLLPAAYIVLAALIPYLPIAIGQLAIAGMYATLIGAVWPAARCLSFFLLERWQGWHGRWSTPLAGVACLIGGFALSILSPALLPWGPALTGLILGLTIFGTGMAIIYAASLYYTMEVGAAEVDAGGLFETLIGSGYVIGPACGLLAVMLAERGAIAQTTVAPFMITLVSLIALVILGLAIRQALRSRAPGANT